MRPWSERRGMGWDKRRTGRRTDFHPRFKNIFHMEPTMADPSITRITFRLVQRKAQMASRCPVVRRRSSLVYRRRSSNYRPYIGCRGDAGCGVELYA